MEFVAGSERQTHRNSPECVVHEYATTDPNINGAVIELNGRYPAEGWSVNTECTAMILVLGGEGMIYVEAEQRALYPEDRVIIQPGEHYYLEGEDLKLDYASTPSWNPEQYKIVL